MNKDITYLVAVTNNPSVNDRFCHVVEGALFKSLNDVTQSTLIEALGVIAPQKSKIVAVNRDEQKVVIQVNPDEYAVWKYGEGYFSAPSVNQTGYQNFIQYYALGLVETKLNKVSVETIIKNDGYL